VERNYIIGAILSANYITIIKVDRFMKVEHTDKLRFNPDINDTGFNLLLRLLSQSFQSLGYIEPVVPTPFKSKAGFTYSNFCVVRPGSLNNNSVSISPRNSAVYKATCST